MNRRELGRAAISAADHCLKAKGYISMVDVLMELGKLSREDYERWRRRQVAFLERVIHGNLAKLNVILRAVQSNSARGKLKTSWTAYLSWGKGQRQPLRFTKSGDPNLERAYATHYLLPRPAQPSGQVLPQASGASPAAVNRIEMEPMHRVSPIKKACALLLVLSANLVGLRADEFSLRASQIGYRPQDTKIGIAFAKAPLPASFTVVVADTGKVVFEGKPKTIAGVSWGQFENHVELDFSALKTPGSYVLRLGESRSLPFTIGDAVYGALPDQLLEFMREQRCGYNPWLDAVCHPFDGRTAYGPLTNGTYLDARGGWHDAADLLKYLLTSGNATAQLLLAFQLARPAADHVNALGQPYPNGMPDVLDEARWGLEWMLRLHPAPDQLYHQVADDRDHTGRRLPQNEIADYGWGKGGARVVYFADGQPQGLRQYKSVSTGVANLAGRYASAMALAYQIWKEDAQQRPFAERCLQAGREVYELGRAKEGVQQGNSYGAPYRYEETTWADDMEWGAAELFRATRLRRYLGEAKRYAKLATAESWMGKEQTGHYQYYPFMNAGHFRLYDLVDRQFKKQLATYYREGIEQCVRAGERNPYRIGVPFIWCSANLTVALATQCLFYERMTGDHAYRDFAARQRDWLLGRNPWGYTMFTEVGSAYPKDPHLMTVQLTERPVRGGLVDGPVYERIFKSLKGVAITEPDPLAAFQGPAVYHDDVQDYSSNEPTMDGTASAILLWALCSSPVR